MKDYEERQYKDTPFVLNITETPHSKTDVSSSRTRKGKK